MKRVFELIPGDKLWMYSWEPMEPCCPVLEKSFTISQPVTNLTEFYLIDKKGKESRHVIKVLDSGVNAHVKGKYYIWMTEQNLPRAYELIRDYFMERLCDTTEELKKLTQVFVNLEGWDDCYKARGKFEEEYSDNNVEVTF